MIEKIIFNVLAFSLFTVMFFKLIKKNDTSYVYLIVLQFIGITVNFFELVMGKSFGAIAKIFMYITAIFMPVLVIVIEKIKKIELFDVLYYILAKSLMSVGRYNDARKYLIHIIKRDKNNEKAHELLAKVYEKLEKYDLALEEYQIVCEINSKNYEAMLSMGEINNRIGRKKEAIVVLADLLKRKPDYYEASMLLGNIYYYEEAYKESTMIYMSALRYRPDSYELNYYIGMSFTMLNDFNRAKEFYKKAATINSNLYHARFSIGQIELIAGEIENAKMEFMQCINIEELETEAYYYIARIAMINGNLEQAQNYANIAIEENPLMYDRMAEENIFSPIIEKIHKPQNGSKRKTEKEITQREKMIDIHLHEMTNLVGKLSNNDLDMIENMKKNKERIMEQERDEIM